MTDWRWRYWGCLAWSFLSCEGSRRSCGAESPHGGGPPRRGSTRKSNFVRIEADTLVSTVLPRFPGIVSYYFLKGIQG